MKNSLISFLVAALLAFAYYKYEYSEEVKSGIVADKFMIGEHSYIYSAPMLIGKVIISQQHTGWKPDSYYVTVLGVSRRSGHLTSVDFEVDALEYRKVIIGSKYPKP